MIADIALATPPIVMMTLGLFLMFRVLGELDLSVDAVYTNGAAMMAVGILTGFAPWLALLLAAGMGASIGVLVFAVHRWGRTAYLLASLIVLTGFYSINLRILGGATVGLINQPSIFDSLALNSEGTRIGLLIALVAAVIVGLYAFLKTAFGLSMRASGNNPIMARSNGVNTRRTLLAGAVMAGALYGLGGALQVQIQGYADITMGIGAIIVCVAAIFIGELFFPPEGRVGPSLAGVVVGSTLYVLILTVALRSGLPPTDLRLATAAILLVAVILSSSRLRARVLVAIQAIRERVPSRARGAQTP